MSRYAMATVSIQALQHNLQQVRAYAPHSKVIAMIKANAYGHGLIRVAKALHQADALGVACLQEALQIRQAGLNNEIVLMEGIFNPLELPLVQTHQLTLVVHHWQQIQALQNYSHQAKFTVWMKVNTGMNRLGFQANELEEAYRLLKNDPRIAMRGFMTHFSQAEEQSSDFTTHQCRLFAELTKDYPGAKSLANSAAILAWPQSHAQWVRPGLMLYGASPFEDKTAEQFNLIPAMSVYSQIIAVRELSAGERVSYGGTWQSTIPCQIAMVAFGYGDGYPWHAQSGTPVLVNGKRATTVGRIAMDMLAIDVTHLKVKVGDQVTLWGHGLPVEEVAKHAQTIPYELFCRFTERVTVQSVE